VVLVGGKKKRKGGVPVIAEERGRNCRTDCPVRKEREEKGVDSSLREEKKKSIDEKI